MDAARWAEVGQIAAAAAELSGPEREAYLAGRCADAEVRAQVESLLDAGIRSGPLDTPALAFLDPPLSGTRIGPYRVMEQIGRGGMGLVYRAEREDGEFQRQVAIKVVSPLFRAPEIGRRFQAEKQIVAGLRHPNIAQLLDAGTTDEGVPYLVMELIGGLPIDQYCSQNRLPLVARLRLMQQVCEGVQFAHANLIVHRDLKPGNILVTPGGTPKLLDFGISKMLPLEEANSESTRLETRLMTLSYASPEQVRGQPVSTASDVYSLGLVLYEVLAGRPAYRADDHSLQETLRRICEVEPPRPSHAAPPEMARQLAGDLDNIVMKAISKVPSERYGSARDLAGDIENYLTGRPVRAVQATPSYRARKWIRRHRFGVGAATAMVTALIAAAFSVVWQAQVAERERRSAVAARQVAERRQTEAEAARRAAEQQRSLAETNRRLADEQRAAAERRFQEVRKLANQVLFDYQDQLASLSAASKLRARMAADALEYLDALSGDRISDVDLQLELARGYREVALVQGVPRQTNLGDSTGARHSLQKAQTILEGILRARPGFRPARFQRGWILLQLSRTDPENSVKLARLCLREWEELHREAPQDNAILRGLAWAHLRLAELGRPVEHGTQAVSCFERLLRREPDDATFLSNAAYAHRVLAEGFRESGEPQSTLDHGLKAKALTERAIGLTGNPGARKLELSFGIEFVGLGLRESGRPKESLHHFREAVRLREEVYQSNREDAFVQHRLLNGYMQLGIALAEMKDREAGEAWRNRVAQLIPELTLRGTDEWNKTLGWIHSTSGVMLANLHGNGPDTCEQLRLADQHFSAVSAGGVERERATRSRWDLVRNQISLCQARSEVRE
jgi:tetratricopeptide (TPR) repeat protein